MSVYAMYMLFTIYEVDLDLRTSGNLYRDLGVPLDVDDRGINTKWRRLNIQYHPDKVEGDQMAANNYYVHLKNAKDVLIDPVKRFAYDRFGNDVFECQSCITILDYERYALGGRLLQGVSIAVALMAANTLGYFKDGAYWRYLALLTLLYFEARTAMRPDHPPILTKLLNPLLTSTRLRPSYLPFEFLILIRKSAYSAAIFLGLLIPLYREQRPQASAQGEDSEEARHKQIDRLTGLAREVQSDSTRLLDLESTPFKADERAKGNLRNALKMWMVNNVIHGEKDVRNAIGTSLLRRRQGAPAGARGTK